MIKACIFDMDGVIVDSAKYHYMSWQRLSKHLGFEFSEAQNEMLKGISRMNSLEIVLENAGISLPYEEKVLLCEMKNGWFNEYIDTMTSDEILPGVLDFISDLKHNNIKIALGSASRNANKILTKIGMLEMFDAIVDGTHVEKAKPNPEVFLLGAKLLDVAPQHCVVFEDAQSGVEAAIAGNMKCVGIGTEDILGKANFCISSFEGLNFAILQNKLKE
jgi:beta-phosphoglucomutase